jgi:hypothetical protein
LKIDLSSDWKIITIKYSNKCCICDETIPQGSKELWKQGEGVKHQSCVGMNKIEIPQEEKIQTKGNLIESKWHDPKIHPYGTVITHCQFCGTDLSRFKDTYINLDRYCCSTCFGLY